MINAEPGRAWRLRRERLRDIAAVHRRASARLACWTSRCVQWVWKSSGASRLPHVRPMDTGARPFREQRSPADCAKASNKDRGRVAASQRPGHRNRTQGHEHSGIERRAKRPLTHPAVADAHMIGSPYATYREAPQRHPPLIGFNLLSSRSFEEYPLADGLLSTRPGRRVFQGKRTKTETLISLGFYGAQIRCIVC